MIDWQQTMSSASLLSIAGLSVIFILIMILLFKVHAFITLISVSLVTAFATGIPTENILPVMTDSFSSTLGSVALLVGLGAMLGKLVENSGGAKLISETLINKFGEKKAPLALGIASLTLGLPIFFDAGLIVMLPIVFAVARRLSGPILLYAIPTAAAFSVMHVFAPPHPGPVTASELYHANLGLLLITSLVVAIPTWYISGYMWGKFVSKKHKNISTSFIFGASNMYDAEYTNTPKISTVIFCILLPVLLISMNTTLDYLKSSSLIVSTDNWYGVIHTVGSTPIALLISVFVAMLLLNAGQEKKGIEKILDSSLAPICSVVLITGAGGMFGGVLRASGIGDAVSHSLTDLGLPTIVAAYFIAVMVRIAQGSATVALVTAASLMAPTVLNTDFTQMQIVAITLATASGSVFAGHVNDSGFWLVGKLLNMNVKTTLKTWTVQQTIESLIGFAISSVLFMIF